MVISKNKALVLLCKLLALLLAGAVVVGIVTFSILATPAAFSDTYNGVMQRKYENLKNTQGKKIVVVGGSNAAFGIAVDYMEEQTGYSVVNMGLYAGFGQLFNTQIMKSHIKEGDIVLLSYEYGLYSEAFDTLGHLDNIMVAIDDNLEMYKEIPLRNFPEIIGNVFSFARLKAEPRELEEGVYSSDSFDEKGNMILERSENIMLDYKSNIHIYNQVSDGSMCSLSGDYAYLSDLREYVESRGAQIFFVAPPLLEDAYTGTAESLVKCQEYLTEQTGIPYISNAMDYMLPAEYMFDTIYHCNEAGELKRTELLVNDLRNYGIIE